MEVLVGATVFIIGFAIIIMALNGTLAKLSTNEITTAGGLAREYMEQTVLRRETMPLDTLVDRSGLRFRIQRITTLKEQTAEVRLQISRPRQKRVLVDIYHEYPLLHE